ncbi:SCO6745 family protein [Mycolicibacillus koreensis]|uniref:EvbL n=1 Tax=Mycolicibacillus koreensis TaxID=1069220 RepID=A0AA91SQ97_9MYCO|nr:evbL [Mycolicibacillus koreensis]OSC27775.1 evbL [Mycolicibacillus koreensis]
MTDTALIETTAATGAAMGETVALFMLHPQTFADSTAAGYQNPLAGYVAARGGVLGEATGTTVAAVFTVFEPATLAAMWDEGVAVRGAAGAAEVYWEQTAEFARRHLGGVDGLERLAALGEKLIAAAPTGGLALFAGWRAMPLAADAPARALQVMFVLRELRAAVHFHALMLAGISPVEAHMLNKGPQYTAMFGWPEPFADGADKKDAYTSAEGQTNRWMAQLSAGVLDTAETEELGRLAATALAAVQASAAT